MTVSEWYASVGGNYAEAAERLMSDRLIVKFVSKFPDDPNFGLLQTAVREQRWDDAFAFSHTLKGVVLNLAFARLSASLIALTDALRPEHRSDLTPQRINELFTAVAADYESLTAAIPQMEILQ